MNKDDCSEPGFFFKSLEDKLNDPDRKVRLESLAELKRGIDGGKLEKPADLGYVNNHIHTAYSFSPYFPAKALWMAYTSGLCTAGIMDHDSVSGTREFITAGEIIGLATTIGMECRVDFSRTRLAGRRINNPDQISNVYVAMHGIPHTMISEVEAFMKPYLAERIIRNRRMVVKLNDIMAQYGLALDFDADVLPLSQFHEGGSVTERHILFAFSKKLTGMFGRGENLISFIEGRLMLGIPQKIRSYLLDAQNRYYEYDLLGLLKSNLVEAFYIDAEAECPDAAVLADFSRSIGAISAYAYLGDVGDSVTGDKKTNKFEDGYLDELFYVIREIGFNAVTYMPPRNTLAQLKRVKDLCDRHGFFQISGVDINTPRQSFICRELMDPEFSNLVESTWALIGHEKLATADISKAMFSRETEAQYPRLGDRIEEYARTGRGYTDNRAD